MKKSNVYTGTGDDGTTSLVGGQRVSKTHARLEAYGTADELSSHLGLLQTYLTDAHDVDVITRIQCHLFSVGGELATESDGEHQIRCVLLPTDVEWLEREIDAADEGLPGWRGFILPGGTRGASVAHVARCVCRRLERRMYSLAEEAPVDALLTQYVNRLSDYLYVLARKINFLQGVEENLWSKLAEIKK